MKYHLVTFGCQMNKSDSERIMALFEQLNYTEEKNMADADIIILVGCSVRQKAIDRVWGLLKKSNKIKKKKAYKIILTGCVSDEDKLKMKKKVDFIFNIKDLYKLEQYLNEQNIYTKKDYFKTLPIHSTEFQAFVPIMTGCNNFCSYCIVPYVRGREISRNVRDVLKEVKLLVKQGYKEIQLLGQNVNSYNPIDKQNFSTKNPYTHDFAKLLWELNQIKDLKRLFFTSSHPKDMSDEVISALALPKMVNYIHLALQSGDNKILKVMNRKYNITDYYKIIKKIRKVNPDIAIGTDLIIGFPGETDKQFQNTLDFYRKVNFDIGYAALYSPRPGTKSSLLLDNVTQALKKERWREFQKQMKKITLQKNQKYLNKTVSVLIDKVGQSFVEGNSLEMKRVRIKNKKYKIGEIVEVKVYKALEWILEAK